MKRPAASASGPQRGRGEAIGCLLVVLFILYGSLYPFHLTNPVPFAHDLAHLRATWRQLGLPGNFIANVVFYAPLGFFAGAVLLPRRASSLRLLAATAAGAALSIAVELAQFYDASRISTLSDVYANTVGAALGAAFGQTRLGQSWRISYFMPRDRPALLVVLLWFGYRLYPYVPTINGDKYLRALSVALPHALPGLPELAYFSVAWLAIAAIVESAVGPARGFWAFWLLAALEFCGRVLIVGTVLTPTDLFGAVIGFAAWRWLIRPRRWPLGLVALLLIADLAVERFAGFRFAAVPLRDLGWLPFTEFSHDSLAGAVRTLCAKAFTFGSLIWLLWRSGWSLRLATPAVALLLAGFAYAETYLPARPATTTDAAIALILGLLFALLGR